MTLERIHPPPITTETAMTANPDTHSKTIG